MKIVISDINGKIIKLLLIAILWYTQVIQQRFIVIPNMLLILGVLLVAFVLIDRLSRGNRNTQIDKSIGLMGIYILGTFLLGFITSPELSSHLTLGITIVEFYVVMLCICYYSLSRKDIEFLVWNYIIMYLFMSILFILNPIRFSGVSTIRYSFSSTTNPNAFAMQLTVGIWAVLYMIMKNKIKLIPGFIICGIFMYACFQTGSRKGIIGIALCMILWILYSYIPLSMDKSLAKKIGRIVVIGVVSVALIVILIPYFESSTLFIRLGQMFTDEGNSLRYDMYLKGWEYFKTRPLWGYGYDGFKCLYGYVSHSTIVETPISGGIILAVFYFGSYIKIFHRLRNISKNKDSNSYDDLFRVRMMIILFVIMMFYTICVIHVNLLSSYYCFALIISTCAIIENNSVEAFENEYNAI